MAFLYKRKLKNKEVWVVCWTQDGVRKYKHIGDVPKQVAEKILAKIKTDLALKKFGLYEGERKRLSEWKDEYVDLIKKDHSHGTIKRFLTAYEHFYKIIGNKYLDEISSNDIEIWKMKCPGSPVSINIEYRMLKAFFQKAVLLGYLDTNPFRRVKPLKTDRKYPQVIDIESLKKFFEAVQNKEHKTFFLCLLYTGARPGEILSLSWENVDLEKNIMVIQSHTSKSKKERFIYIHPVLKQHLLELEKKSGIIFDFTYDAIRHVFKRTLIKAGLNSRIQLKWFRHTFTSIAVSLSKDMYGTKEILGHSSVTVTEIYTHYNLDKQKEIINNLPSIF